MPEAKSGAERRRVPRVPVDFPVTLTWRRKEHRLQAREFSEYGILVAAAHKEMIGQDVQVGLALNAGESPLTVDGTVVYGTDTSIGIRFKNVPSSDQQTLRAYALAHGIGISRPQS
jgi:hypothetical protein